MAIKRFLSIFLLIIVSFVGCAQVEPQNTIPSPYVSILSNFNAIIDSYLAGTFESDYNNDKFSTPSETLSDRWGYMMVELPYGMEDFERSSFSYKLIDINHDDIQELLLMKEDDTILAIFTMLHGKAILLDAYWSRYKGAVLSSGEIYTYGSSGALDFEYSILQIDLEKGGLIETEKFGMNEGFYKIIDNRKEMIDETEFERIKAEYGGRILLGAGF